jgi:hypothetical protein
VCCGPHTAGDVTIAAKTALKQRYLQVTCPATRPCAEPAHPPSISHSCSTNHNAPHRQYQSIAAYSASNAYYVSRIWGVKQSRISLGLGLNGATQPACHGAPLSANVLVVHAKGARMSSQSTGDYFQYDANTRLYKRFTWHRPSSQPPSQSNLERRAANRSLPDQHYHTEWMSATWQPAPADTVISAATPRSSALPASSSL